MPALAHHPHPLVRKLSSIATLTGDEVDAIVALPMRAADLRANQDIVRDGDRPSRCCLVLEGFACRQKLTPGGRRQILSFHIAGDIPDLQSLYLKVMDHGLSTVTACKVAFINHGDIRALMQRQPRLAGFFWRDTLIDAAIFREWMTGLGRREAFTRMAHFFCEMHAKLEAVSLADGDRFSLPFTQQNLADALGLSVVHVNRTIKELRGARLIVTRGATITVPDRNALVEAGEFDPCYLHMDGDEHSSAA
jgi:CRP-like cAMP-binding protein